MWHSQRIIIKLKFSYLEIWYYKATAYVAISSIAYSFNNIQPQTSLILSNALWYVYRYELQMRLSCPHPYADSDDRVTINCTLGAWHVQAVGQQLYSKQVTGLTPYTQYEFRVLVSNNRRMLEDPPTASHNTRPTGWFGSYGIESLKNISETLVVGC